MSHPFKKGHFDIFHMLNNLHGEDAEGGLRRECPAERLPFRVFGRRRRRSKRGKQAKLLHEKWRFIAGNSLCEWLGLWWIFHCHVCRSLLWLDNSGFFERVHRNSKGPHPHPSHEAPHLHSWYWWYASNYIGNLYCIWYTRHIHLHKKN